APACVRGFRLPHRHARPGGGGADPRGDDSGLHPAVPVQPPQARASGARGGPPLGALAMSGFEATSSQPAAGLAPPEWGGFDPARTRGGPGDVMRSFRTSTQLGWQMEANWTDPLLFFIYSVAKPVASALILVFMLEVISGGSQPA